MEQSTLINFKGKRVFVSGGAGVIGTYLVDNLSRLGAEIFVGDLKPRPAQFSSDILYRCGDLNTLEPHWLRNFKPQVFIHLAATFERTQESPDFFKENHWHNNNLSYYLLEQMLDEPELESIIYASSYLVYDEELYVTHNYEHPFMLRESDPLKSRNLVGASKLYHEAELEFFQRQKEHNIQAVNARIFRSFGCGSRDVISRWARDAANRKTIDVYDTNSSFDYIDAEDVALALIALVQNKSSGVYNIGSGKATSIEEVVEVLKDIIPGIGINSKGNKDKVEASCACIDKIVADANWKPSCNLKESMERIVHYERSHIDEPVIEDNVLITSISKKVPLVKAVRNAAEKLNPSIRIIGADASADVVAKGFVDHFWHCLPTEQWDFDCIAQYCRENSINAIIPTRDAELPFFAKHLNEFAKAGIHVMVSCEDTVSLCSDKLTFYKNLSAFGINSVETSEAAEEIKGTIVVKERWGSGSQYVYVDCDLDSAKSFAAKLEAPIFQPCVKGREFSTDFYVDKEGKLKGVVSRWRTKIVAGESQVTETFHSLEIEDIVGRLADKFLFFGHCVLQGFVDSLGKIHILEVNTRFGGASPLSIAAGLDSFYWFLLEANGQPVGEYPFFRVLDELKLIRYPADVIQSSNSDLNAASSKTSISNEMALSYLEPADSPARR